MQFDSSLGPLRIPLKVRSPQMSNIPFLSLALQADDALGPVALANPPPARPRGGPALTLRERERERERHTHTTSRFYHPSLNPRRLAYSKLTLSPSAVCPLSLSLKPNSQSVRPSVRGLPCVQVLSIPQSSSTTTTARRPLPPRPQRCPLITTPLPFSSLFFVFFFFSQSVSLFAFRGL